MRLLTSMQIKKEADLYINFLDGEVDVHTFCALEVEPMFRESDIVHVHALSKVNISSFKSSHLGNFENNCIVIKYRYWILKNSNIQNMIVDKDVW